MRCFALHGLRFSGLSVDGYDGLVLEVMLLSLEIFPVYYVTQCGVKGTRWIFVDYRKTATA
jgi:hypothetical protein